MGKEYLSFNEKTAIERFKYLFKIIHSKKGLLAHPLSILLIFPKKLSQSELKKYIFLWTKLYPHGFFADQNIHLKFVYYADKKQKYTYDLILLYQSIPVYYINTDLTPPFFNEFRDNFLEDLDPLMLVALDCSKKYGFFTELCKRATILLNQTKLSLLSKPVLTIDTSPKPLSLLSKPVLTIDTSPKPLRMVK